MTRKVVTLGSGTIDALAANCPPPTPVSDSAGARRPGCSDHVIRVDHKGGDLFEIAVRHHVLQVDQPVDAGGGDAAPTPTELFVVSLASCVAFYARRFLARHDLPSAGLSVTAQFTMAERPARVGAITLSIEVPAGVPDERRPALLAVASHCTVHNSIERPPNVEIELAHGDEA